MEQLKSYLEDSWVSGEGAGAELHDPCSAEVVATASTRGLDFAAALQHARRVGGKALRALSFQERGRLLAGLSEAIHAAREELIDLSRINAGCPRSDAKFDVDGATATLMAYAQLAEKMSEKGYRCDGPSEQLGRSPRFSGRHIKVPRRGVALHINAYNFPLWGPAEKMACALLAGMPVITKPATATALPSFRMAELIVNAGILPEGAFSFVAGSVQDLLDHLGPQDVIAFTGSAGTGRKIRSHPAVIQNSVRVNVEADSLNAAVVGPDVERGSECWRLFIRELGREVAQKSGQKCTATRRVFLSEGQIEGAIEDLREEFASYPMGEPDQAGVRMGPLSTRAQAQELRRVLDELTEETEIALGALPDGDGAFCAPIVLLCRSPKDAARIHEMEAFGPVTTLMPYDGSVAAAADLVARGEGTLVTTLYSDDLRFTEEALFELAPWTGRLLLGSKRIAEYSTGPGLVLPQLVHGGPGRAGGGLELGGERGLDLYTQTVAVQGARPVVDRILGK